MKLQNSKLPSLSFLLDALLLLSEKNFIYKAVSRDFLGTLFFERVVFPDQHHGCLEVRKLQVFNTSDLLKTYSVRGVKYETLVPYEKQ